MESVMNACWGTCWRNVACGPPTTALRSQPLDVHSLNSTQFTVVLCGLVSEHVVRSASIIFVFVLP